MGARQLTQINQIMYHLEVGEIIILNINKGFGAGYIKMEQDQYILKINTAFNSIEFKTEERPKIETKVQDYLKLDTQFYMSY